MRTNCFSRSIACIYGIIVLYFDCVRVFACEQHQIVVGVGFAHLVVRPQDPLPRISRYQLPVSCLFLQNERIEGALVIAYREWQKANPDDRKLFTLLTEMPRPIAIDQETAKLIELFEKLERLRRISRAAIVTAKEATFLSP